LLKCSDNIVLHNLLEQLMGEFDNVDVLKRIHCSGDVRIKSFAHTLEVRWEMHADIASRSQQDHHFAKTPPASQETEGIASFTD